MMKKIGIIGFGNMGSVIAERVKSADAQIWVFDKDKNKIKGLSGVNISESGIDLVKNVEIVILAVKPQDFEQVLEDIKGAVKGKLVISIAAGITTGYIERKLETAGQIKVVRAMPNMPARIGKGMTCLSKGRFAGDGDLGLAKELFAKLGKILILEENMMNAATAISGSGPGYCYDLIESQRVDIHNDGELKKFKSDFSKLLEKAAVSVGFNVSDAALLAVTTTSSSLSLIQLSGSSAAELKKQITSKGGTTEAALAVLNKGGTLEDAAKAALNRAKELSME